jgi:hypothetical protein
LPPSLPKLRKTRKDSSDFLDLEQEVSWEGTSSTCNLEKAVFFKDRCHLLEGREFLKVLRELERLNTEALHFRILNWLAE